MDNGVKTTCAVSVRLDKHVFHPGDDVKGQVLIKSEFNLDLSVLYINIKGSATMAFAGQLKAYSHSETYIDKTQLLYRKDPSSPALHPSTYIFPFTFRLPDSLPSSYNDLDSIHGRNVQVAYILTTSLAEQGDTLSTRSQSLTVVRKLDLGRFPRLRDAAEDSTSKCSGFLGCASGPIVARLRLSRTGFVPGETLKCDVHIRNHSSTAVKQAKLKLVRSATYSLTPDTFSRSEYTVCETKLGKQAHGKLDVQTEEHLLVPATPPSHMHGCRFMDVKYFVKLLVYPARPWRRLVAQIDVVIGSSPVISAIGSGPLNGVLRTGIPEDTVKTGEDMVKTGILPQNIVKTGDDDIGITDSDSDDCLDTTLLLKK